MAFCANCGFTVEEYDKFCPRCGVATRKDYFTGSSEKSARKETYDGEIKKCPNCGEVLKSFEAICPTCGYELRNANTTNYLIEFSQKLELADSESQKVNLIRNFVIPNTKEDIYEFIILATTNLESSDFALDAWNTKLEQAYHKAKLVFGESESIKYVDEMYQKGQKAYKKALRGRKHVFVGLFFQQHTKGITLAVLGVIALTMVIIGVIGLSNSNYYLGIFFFPAFLLGCGIAVAADDWKKK